MHTRHAAISHHRVIQPRYEVVRIGATIYGPVEALLMYLAVCMIWGLVLYGALSTLE